MSTTKRCISLLLALLMVLSMIPVSAMAANAKALYQEETFQTAALAPKPETALSMDTTPEGLVYRIDTDWYSNKYVAIIDYSGNATNLVIPDSIQGFPVTRIEDSAFEYSISLTSVTIPNSVYLIGAYAFSRCSNLVDISISDSVTDIKSFAFEDCSSLTDITIPDSVTRIEPGAFRGCSNLTDIQVAPNNTRYASLDGILFNKDLTSVYCCPGGKNGKITIPDSVSYIEDYAFYGCENLTDIPLPDSVHGIGEYAFSECSNLASVAIPDSVNTIWDNTFGGCTNLTSVTIPDSVTEIRDFAFSGCGNLTDITIPSSVEKIGGHAFSYCSSLTSFTIPNSVYSLGGYVFAYCSSLSNIQVDPDNSFYASLNGVLYNKDLTFLYCCPGGKEHTITIPDSVTNIDSNAFYSCTSLTSITIPDSVTRIGRTAFFSSGLTSFYFEGNCPFLQEDAFFDVTATVYYPAHNETWSESVFEDCGGTITLVPYDPETGEIINPTNSHDTLDRLTELDYLAFSKLAYRNLDQLKGKTVRQVIGDKWDGFWTDGTTTEFLNSEIYGAIANWTVYKTGSGEDGFYYAVFKAPDAGQAVLAYRGSTNPVDIFKGSEDAIGDWIWNDLPMLLGGFIGTQFGDACKAYTDLASDPEIWMISTTGHSLGGAWADAISALYGCDGVSMNAVPILDVVYDTHPQYYGATFTGLSEWNFIDHANVLDVLAGMNEALFSSAPIKPYISHKSMYTGANIATPHSLWPMIQRSSDGSVCITDVTAVSIPNAAMVQERKLSYVSLGSTSNDMLNKGMNSLKRQSAYGGNGEDQIYTGSSWDKLIGGAGFDVLDGGYGDDTYFYFKGDGHDYIRDIGGSDALYLYGYTKDDAITIVEDEDIGLIDVYCNGEPVISIYEDGREYKSFTFDKFEVYVVWGNQDYDVYDITSFFKTRKYGSHLLISCPVSIEILDPNGNVVHTLTDGEVGSWYTEYGNFYVFEEENGEYGKVLDLVEGYTARIVGADEGTMDVTYQVPVDGELTEPVSVSGVPVNENLSATIEETEDGDVYLVIDEDSDGETDSERKLYGECPFTDVPEGSFYYEPVMWAVESGVTAGTSATTFDPSGLCLRAHVVTFLYRAAGSLVPSSNKNPFTDVKSGDFYYNPVLWAVENGITQGISKTQFGSAQVCNRAAVVTFLWRAFGSPEPKSTNNPFVDVKNTDFFYKPVLWAVENGITAGIDATHFNPAGACNRAQVVTFLYRAYN